MLNRRCWERPGDPDYSLAQSYLLLNLLPLPLLPPTLSKSEEFCFFNLERLHIMGFLINFGLRAQTDRQKAPLLATLSFSPLFSDRSPVVWADPIHVSPDRRLQEIKEMPTFWIPSISPDTTPLQAHGRWQSDCLPPPNKNPQRPQEEGGGPASFSPFPSPFSLIAGSVSYSTPVLVQILYHLKNLEWG